MNKRMRLKPRQMKIGQTLTWDVYDEAGNLLLRRGHQITRESQIDSLLERGLYADMSSHPGTSSASLLEDSDDYDPFWVWDRAKTKLARLLHTPTLDEDFSDKVKEISSLIQVLCERSPDLALATIVLLDTKDYPVIHSMHVAVLADLAARRIQWAEKRRISLCCAALTMNIGMIELQAQLAEQATPITPEQRSEVDAHPARAEDMLRAGGVSDEVWLRAVRQHHESPDGKGYPEGVSTPSEEALLLRTADILSAKVSPRASRRSMPPAGAMRSLYLQEGGGASNPFSAVMIKEIGVYPPGTHVKLENGEIGVVQKRGASANTPLVASLVTAQGEQRVAPVTRDTSKPGFAIAAVVAREEQLVPRFSLSHIWKS
jgi:HD-GYP domain-containing protein (c-di-GMP phosphodiesterase class II)